MLVSLAAQETKSKKPTIPPAERLQLLKTFVGEFVEITPGRGKFPKSFRMGSADGPANERPAHEVTLTGGFAIAKYEVPQNLYEAVMGENPSRYKGPRNAAEMMSWRDAHVFCGRITTFLREAKLIDAGEIVALPSEAQWEYCCRAGSTTAYSFGHRATKDGETGNKASLLDPYAWHTGNAMGNDPPVGALKPNAWGLYDMHGYLWEFVSDAWHDSYLEAPADGRSWDGDRTFVPRVIRGGSWRDRFDSLQSAVRQAIPDHANSDAIGLRCVKLRVAK